MKFEGLLGNGAARSGRGSKGGIVREGERVNPGVARGSYASMRSRGRRIEGCLNRESWGGRRGGLHALKPPDRGPKGVIACEGEEVNPRTESEGCATTGPHKARGPKVGQSAPGREGESRGDQEGLLGTGYTDGIPRGT